MDYEEKTFNTGEIDLNYYENVTSDPPFLYLHGAGNIWQTIIPILSELSTNWSVYAYDSRGRGKSSWHGGLDLLKDHLQDAISFVENKIPDPTVVFGWSMGGVVGSMLASERPDQVKALIIGDAPLFIYEDQEQYNYLMKSDGWREFITKSYECRDQVDSLEEYIKETANFKVDFPSHDEQTSLESLIRSGIKDDEIFHIQAESYYRLNKGVVESWFNAELTVTAECYNTKEMLPKITCPTLILQGDPAVGGMVSDKDVNQMMKLIPNATHVRLDKIGHGLHLTHKEEIYKVITDFLNNID